MERVLNFLFTHNISLIESLLVLIFGMLLFLFYRVFFASNPMRMEGANPSFSSVSINTQEIEKTLQKLVETQQSSLANLEAKVGSGGGGSEGTVADPSVVKENSELKRTLEQKNAALAELEKNLADANKAVKEAGAAGAAKAGGDPALTAKLKELEARLAEYEIISEDISDLSHFKEENARLTSELQTLRQAGATQPAPNAGVPEVPVPVAAPTVAAVQAAPPASVEETASFEAMVPPVINQDDTEELPENVRPLRPKNLDMGPAEIDETSEAELEPTINLKKSEAVETKKSAFSGPAGENEIPDEEAFAGIPDQAINPPDADETPEASLSGSSVIDDELMREFEAAVENQKMETMDPNGVKDSGKDKKPEDEQAELLDQFESFVKKA